MPSPRDETAGAFLVSCHHLGPQGDDSDLRSGRPWSEIAAVWVACLETGRPATRLPDRPDGPGAGLWWWARPDLSLGGLDLDAVARHALEAFGEEDDSWGMAFARLRMAAVDRAGGLLDHAEQVLQPNLAIDSAAIHALSLDALARLALARGRVDVARSLHSEARQSAPNDGPALEGRLLETACELALSEGDPERAVEEGIAAVRTLRRCDAVLWAMRAAAPFTRACLRAGTPSQAFTAFSTLPSEVDTPRGATLCLARGEVELATGRPNEARSTLSRLADAPAGGLLRCRAQAADLRAAGILGAQPPDVLEPEEANTPAALELLLARREVLGEGPDPD